MRRIQEGLRPIGAFLRRHWLGTLIILVFTCAFFWPIVTRISSFSEGGDAMFNAWTLARDHHCLTFDGCPNYADGNIFFPHKYSMFYSETQLSAGLLTLPLYFINPNPIFAYNVWTIASFFFSGWFMYLLAKRLSRNNEAVSVIAGLVFAFAPFKITAVTHLQSLSIFYLPLAVLLMLRYFDTAARRYLAGFFVTVLLLFYASWYQTVFALVGIGILLLALVLTKQVARRLALFVAAAIAAAAVLVLPLAVQYMQFSKSNNATFSLGEQTGLSSSLTDYVTPFVATMAGKVYYKVFPAAHRNAYNPDSVSYHGIVLYAVAAGMLVTAVWAYRQVRRHRPKAADEGARQASKASLVYVTAFVAIALAGFIISLGPFLRLRGSAEYNLLGNGVGVVLPLPWLAVDTLVPQLQFIRAIGRASVLTLFGLACLLAYLPAFLEARGLKPRVRYGIIAAVCALVVFELMPTRHVFMTQGAYAYGHAIPAVYKVVRSDPSINNLIVLRSDKDYPGAPFAVARTEDVLWAGYHNKNIYNGYSGYMPPGYFEQYADLVDLQEDDLAKMKHLGLRYVIVDKLLSSSGVLPAKARQLLPQPVYEDERYIMFKL